MMPPSSSLLLTACLLTLHAPPVRSFGSFKLPPLPWNAQPGGGSSGTVDDDDGALRPGDTVAVVGASGNVGKLVALRLSDTYKVNGIVRDVASVGDFFAGREDKIQLYEADLLDETRAAAAAADGGSTAGGSCSASLTGALRDANAVVICTGTTAFPTKAWTRSGSSNDVSRDVLDALLNNSFSVKDAIASLDADGLNTPNNVDAASNEFVVRAWNDACRSRQKRIIMLSSIGVRRRESMPFPILNACGVLDAKAAGEDAIRTSAEDNGYSYTIVRPGQLFGGPYDNNYYLGTLFQLDKDEETRDVRVGRGDELLGDTLRSTLAEVTAQICEGNYGRDMDFAVVNERGESPSVEAVRERLGVL